MLKNLYRTCPRCQQMFKVNLETIPLPTHKRPVFVSTSIGREKLVGLENCK